MKLRIAVGFGASMVAAALAAWIGTELVMAPVGSERNRLIAMYGAIVGAVFVVGVSLTALTRRSLNRRILAASVSGPLVVGITTIYGASSMFISSHDTQFVVILTALATVVAAGLVHLLSSPLIDGLRQITDAAGRVGQGDLSARTELSRSDELGKLGAAFDSMAERIEQSATEQVRVEEERRFMLSALSHDARTPLTAMRAAVEALQDGVAPDPARYLDSIEHDLRAIEAIIENLFVIGKLDARQLALHIEELDLVAVAVDAVDAIEPLARKHEVELLVEADEAVPVKAARIETERMIANLLSNAIRHSPPKATVRVVVGTDPQPNLSVCDQGPGFSEDFVEKAFEQFERAEDSRTRTHGGAGLGLAVVRGLAEAQGGRVWADPGPGGVVTFELPSA